MKVGSLFSGIGGFDLGFERAGFKTVWQVEKEPFCIAVLKTHFPNVERYYDVLKCGHDRIHKLRAVDVLTAGFPCQDLSVAGKRAGLEGARSGLFWEVVRIVGELRPTWFVLENVPGLFSSGEGRDFAVVLNAMDELGYGLAWRVLNSQFFGVAQRRRRVFIVGCLGKPCPQEVLFESESGGGDFETGEEARPELASDIAASLRGVGGSPRGFNLDAEQGLVATSLSRSAGRHGHSSPRGDGSDNLVLDNADEQRERLQGVRSGEESTSNGSGPESRESGRGCDRNIVQQAISSKWSKGSSGPAGDEHHNLTVASLSGMGNGGPDDNDGQAGRIVSSPSDTNGVRDFAELPEGMDSARYRALGNAVTVSVAEWIANRIKSVVLTEREHRGRLENGL